MAVCHLLLGRRLSDVGCGFSVSATWNPTFETAGRLSIHCRYDKEKPSPEEKVARHLSETVIFIARAVINQSLIKWKPCGAVTEEGKRSVSFIGRSAKGTDKFFL